MLNSERLQTHEDFTLKLKYQKLSVAMEHLPQSGVMCFVLLLIASGLFNVVHTAADLEERGKKINARLISLHRFVVSCLKASKVNKLGAHIKVHGSMKKR